MTWPPGKEKPTGQGGLLRTDAAGSVPDPKAKGKAIRTNPGECGPWCWQEKQARRVIRERMNGDSKTVYVLSVYDALSEIASDEEAETFKTSHPYLAAKAGCGVSQLKIALGELKEAGLIDVDTPKLKGPCTFTLLCVSRIAPIDSHNAASVSHKTFSGSVATVEEKKKKGHEEKRNKAASAVALLPYLFRLMNFAPRLLSARAFKAETETSHG